VSFYLLELVALTQFLVLANI